MRLLIVDDCPDIRYILGLLLAEEGHEVVGVAEGGQRAVALAAEHHPEIVILDLMMPDMDGVDAVGRILGASPGSRIVTFSAAEQADVADAVLSAGAVASLDKLNGPEVVIDLLERLPA